MTIHSSTIAERVDRAVDALLSGQAARSVAATTGLQGPDRELVRTGELLRDALVVAVAPRFEARLGARLAEAAQGSSPVGWARRHPRRLIVTGAVSSAVGVGVTAYAVWRSTRRSTGPAHRLLHR